MGPQRLLQTTVLLLATSPLLGQETDQATEALKKNPNSAAAIRTFLKVKLGEIQLQMRTDAKEARQVLDDTTRTLQNLALEEAEAQQEQAKAMAFLEEVERRIALVKAELAELADKLKNQPDDKTMLREYVDKVMQTVAELEEQDLARAAKTLSGARELLESLQGDVEAKRQLAGLLQSETQSLARLESRLQARLAHQEKLAKLAGQTAPPLTADTWINGQPLNEQATHDKVVLLSFWAVWCGPAMRTFPTLNEWNQKFGSRQLTIVSVVNRTRQYMWDAVQQRAVSSATEISKAQEDSMLAKFAQAQEIPFVIAVQADTSLCDAYVVEKIPQFVLIDRHGIIRLARAGADAGTLQQVGDMIAQLVHEEKDVESGK